VNLLKNQAWCVTPMVFFVHPGGGIEALLWGQDHSGMFTPSAHPSRTADRKSPASV
jgi:hypothetical protein